MVWVFELSKALWDFSPVHSRISPETIFLSVIRLYSPRFNVLIPRLRLCVDLCLFTRETLCVSVSPIVSQLRSSGTVRGTRFKDANSVLSM